ncbi:MAG: adenylosuccinate synthase [Candidatus Micrarchaeota archaeon]|nr:adenylosuccinate synthase [Candidatus Micrarchaeota archaeon]
MTFAIVVGTQWGDEGKGKVVDYYAAQADIVVRYCGGANAGHTIVSGGRKFAFHHVPSGVLYPEKINIIGNGVVLEPKKFFEELGQLDAVGIKPNIKISPRVHLVMPYHVAQDGAEEGRKGALAAGTTKRGIGPCYSDKAARFGIRVGELLQPELFREKLHTMHTLKVKLLKEVYGVDFTQSEDEICKLYTEYGKRLAPFVADTGEILSDALSKKKQVLFEGAQATMLDIDHGMYPFGTSSNTSAGGACTGSGIGPTAIDEVIGVVKVYTSRVGAGPLPTELNDATGQAIRDKGGEYGTTTGRPRRIGWLDLPTLRYAAHVNGLTGLAFTRLDTLSGMQKVQVCTHYELDGKKLLIPPASYTDIARCRPIYKSFAGWDDIGADKWRACAKGGMKSLPARAQAYLKFISGEVRVPIYVIGVGAGREDTIVLKEVFSKKA